MSKKSISASDVVGSGWCNVEGVVVEWGQGFSNEVA